MHFKISGGASTNGIVVGNVYDKYNSKKTIARWMQDRFASALENFVIAASPRSIHDIGCGEGYWVLRWSERAVPVRGCDFSAHVIEMARENAISRGLSPALFTSRSIYDLDARHDHADLVVCCEVLEHVDNPEDALLALQKIVGRHLIVSIPQEPLWCMLNLLRGKYISRWGNTPGHIQHWSKNEFIRLVSKYFKVIDVKSPLPWTMILCRPHDPLGS
jgi:2-polyprenyl-3-methyl-5-hydroxy-6-metoxy-1,4-benzoquinol methylase